jgi:glycosyltransferase involved in cell wall biosynthesis
MGRHGRKIHVVQVIGTMHIGGAEHAVVALCRGLDRSRFDVTLCCTRERGVLAEKVASEGVDVRLAAPTDNRLRHATPYFLHRMLAELKPDVVHTHGTPSLLHAGPLAALGLLAPWVHTFHYGNYPLPNRRYMTGERIFSHYASRLVAVSDAQRQALMRYHRIAPARIETIVNGVAANPFLDDPSVRAARRAELGFGDDDVVVGCVAVLSAQKGISVLLQAARTVVDRNPRVRFLIAGGGPLERQLRAEAAALGLGSRAVFTGWRQDNLELLTALDVFTMSSLWEAMPLALLEAMAARRPIVVTDVGDNRLVVAGGECGVVVPPSDAAALAAGIERLVRDPAAAAAMAARAQDRFERQFTTAHMLANYETCFEAIATGSTL